MSQSVVALFAVAAVAAVVDWIAVWSDRQRVVYVAKPAVLVALIAAAVMLPGQSPWFHWWTVAGLVFGLGGDVALMVGKFVPGAASFAVGHVCYVIGWTSVARSWPLAVAGGIVFAVVGLTVGRAAVVGARQRSPKLGGVVAGYQFLLGAMLAAAWSTALVPLMAGATLFAASDTLLGWSRFVRPEPRLRVVVHVLYHLAQALIVLSLAG
jgi:uncharacterized membrane protein YhhN